MSFSPFLSGPDFQAVEPFPWSWYYYMSVLDSFLFDSGSAYVVLRFSFA